MDNSIILNDDMATAHRELETIFRSGAEEYKKSINQMGLSLYHMQESGTWRVAENHEGELFTTWDSYIRWLGDDTGLSRSSMFDYKGMVRFALVNGLVNSTDEFIDRGGVLTFRYLKKETICNSNGEIVGFKNVDLDEPIALAKEIIEIIDPESRPMDQVKLIKETVNKNVDEDDFVEIFLRLKPSNEGGYNLVWARESNAGHEEGLVQYSCPDDVYGELKSKFHILE